MLRRLLIVLTAASLLLLVVAVLLPSRPTDPAPVLDGPNGRPSDWFWQQRAFPHGAIDPAGYRLALEQAAAKHADATLRRLSGDKSALDAVVWQQARPHQHRRPHHRPRRRTRATATWLRRLRQGGVFAAPTAGQSWSPIFDQGDVIAVGDDRPRPAGPRRDLRRHRRGQRRQPRAFFGTGLYRSPDAGRDLGASRPRGHALHRPHRSSIPPTARRVFVAATGQLFGTRSRTAASTAPSTAAPAGSGSSPSPTPPPASTWP